LRSEKAFYYRNKDKLERARPPTDALHRSLARKFWDFQTRAQTN
jgi:hypothetical protein